MRVVILMIIFNIFLFINVKGTVVVPKDIPQTKVVDEKPVSEVIDMEDDDDDLRNNYKPLYTSTHKKPSSSSNYCPPCTCICSGGGDRYEDRDDNYYNKPKCGPYSYYSDSPGCTCYKGYVADHRGNCVPKYKYCDNNYSHGHHHHDNNEDDSRTQTKEDEPVKEEEKIEI